MNFGERWTSARQRFSSFVAGLEDRERKRLLVASGLLAGVMLLLCVLLFWLPGIVLGRARARAAQIGLAIDAEDVEVGINGVAFEGLRVRDVKGGDLVVSASRLAIGVAWWRGGASREAIRRIRLDGGEVSLSAAGAQSLLSRLPKRREVAPAAKEPKEARPLPQAELHDLVVRLKDEHGELVLVEGGALDVVDGEVHGAADRVVLGDAHGDTVELLEADASLDREANQWALKKASVAHTRLGWASDDLSAEHNKVPPTLARIRRLREVVSRSDAPAQVTEPETPRKRWLAPSASVDLNDTDVVARDAAGKVRELLRDLHVQVTGVDDAVRVRASGKGTSGGSVSCDVKVHPGEGRIEGNVALDELSLALFGPVLPPLPFYELAATKVSGTLSLSGEGLEQVRARGELALSDLTFASEGLARTAVGPMNVAAEGEATWVPARRELTVSRATVRLADLAMNLTGVAAWPSDGYRVAIATEIPKISCAHALAAVPVGLFDELATIELGGDISARVTAQVDSANLDATKVDFDVHDGCRFLSVPATLDLTRFQQPFTHRALEPDGSIFEMETGPGTAAWTSIDAVSPFFLQAVIAHEDGRFVSHHGFAESEIAVALARNLKARAFRFGASTITMQLVKNVFLHREKLLSRKIQEALITWWLEQQWDKRHLLELYVNVIEYGPAIYGIRNAALHYFGTIPMNLTPAQSAFLATILPGPKLFHTHYEKGSLSPSMKHRVALLLKHMRSRDRIDDEALAFGLEELEHFAFYRPDQPPPTPVIMRGRAQLPFDVGASIPSQAWDLLDNGAMPEEDGSYGSN